jgi:type IV pilus assembly protein PilM
MVLFSSRKQALVGLDIGSHSVKLVELSESKGAYKLKNFAMANLPQDVIVDGAVMDSGAIIDVVKGLISQTKLKNKKVAISISGFSVIIKKIAVAMMSEEELLESIQWEAAQYIPFEIEDVNIDFQILGQNRDNPDQMDVLLVAAKKETITDYENLILGAGLELQLIDVDSFAVETMYENLFGIGEEEVIALVNLGASTTNVNVVKGPISLYTKDVPVGGKQLTQEIQKQYGLSFEEAENLKLAGPQLWASQRNLDKIINNHCEVVASEIQRSLDLFYATYPEEQIQRIGLCGGGAMTPGLVDQVRERLGIEVQLINPFEKISYSPKEYEDSYVNSVGPMAVVGVGLAMRRVGDR